MSLRLLARSPDRSIIGVLTEWTALEVTVKFNRVGSWRLTIPHSALPTNWPEPQAGLVVVRDGNVLASGMWDQRGYQWSASDDPGGTVTLTGDTDLARVGYRIVYPDEDSPFTDQTAASHYTFTDQEAHAVVRTLVNDHAGGGALPTRQVPGLTFGAPPASSPLISISERFTPLLEACRSAALAGNGLGFDITDDLAGNYVFSVYQPADLTGSARFAPRLGNLTALARTRESPTGNVALIAGKGEGTARDTAEFQLDTSVNAWGRREVFLDQRSADPSEYDKAVAEQFERSAGRDSVSADIVSTEQLAFGRDWNLGSKVTISPLVGEELAEVVTEVILTATPAEGERITARVGSEHVRLPPHLARLADLDERLSRLERGL